MNSVDQTLPDNVESLTELVFQLRAKLSHQSNYIKQLVEAIQLARHQHFGARSEKFNVDQLSLLFNEAETLADHETDDQDKVDDSGGDKTTVGPYQRRKGGYRIITPVLRSSTRWRAKIVSVISVRGT